MFFSKDKIIEVFYESEFNRALSNTYGVEKALLIPQTSNIVPQIPGNISDLYRKFYENFAGMYYHLDVNMLCLPNGIMVINDMSQVTRLIINLLKTPENLEYMNNLLFDKKLPYNELEFALVKFYIEIARTYGCLDNKLESFLSQNNFKVVKAPLMMCLPFGSITMSLANGIPGFNTDGTPVFYTGKPSNVFEEAIYEQFKFIVSDHLKMDIICIDSVSELTKKTLSGLRCITAPLEAFDGFPNTIFDAMNFLTEKYKDDWLKPGTEVTI